MQIALVFLAYLLIFDSVAFAQSRGAGVGALATRTGGSTLVNVSGGKTAPWAEVIVEDGGDNMQAVAEIDGQGIFNFTFYTDSVGDLYVFAVDEIGVTNRVHFTTSNHSNFILPPTIVGEDDDNLDDDTPKFIGFSFPGADIKVTLNKDDAYFGTFETVADGQSGSWTLIIEDLPGGDYIATAKAFFGGLESQESQEVYFEIVVGVEKIVKDVGENIVKVIENLPEPVKETSNIVSKVTVPVATSLLLLQLLLTGLSLKDLFIYFSLLYLWFVGFIRRRKKGKWGIVYDAMTKNPVSGAIVRLYTEGDKLTETDVTSGSGIFSFLPPLGRYRLQIAKPGYNFPSGVIRERQDGEYSSIYLGGIFEINQKRPVVDFSIPIDPRSYEQITKLKTKLRVFFSKHAAKLNLIIFIPGFIFSSITYISNPIFMNKIIMVFYILSLIFFVAGGFHKTRMWGIVKDEEGNPLPGISLSLLDTLLNRQLQRRVTDFSGKYQFIVPAGSYSMMVTTEGWELAPVKRGYSGEPIEVKKDKNVIKAKIFLKKKTPQA